MWQRCNPNPLHKEVSDCVVRALCIALNRTWLDIYDDLCKLGRKEADMPSADAVWGKYLYLMGFQPVTLPRTCPRCLSINRFCYLFPHGVYIIGTGSHAVAVIDGDYYDTWDSGNEIASYFWSL